MSSCWKRFLESLLKFDEELPVFWSVFSVHENPIQTIMELNPTLGPDAFNDLGLPGNRSKALLDFKSRVRKEMPRHRPAVIELQRQQKFEATESVHEWQVLRR
jgi:hypothetical protein